MQPFMIVWFKHRGISKPILKVKEGMDQVIIAFIPFDGEHITLHKQANGSILRTYSSKQKLRSSKTKEEIAKCLRYKNPDRHGKYIAHYPLIRTVNVDGYHILGREIDLDSIIVNKSYEKKPGLTIAAPQSKFMIDLYLSTPDNTYSKNKPYLPTKLGKVFVELNKL